MEVASGGEMRYYDVAMQRPVEDEFAIPIEPADLSEYSPVPARYVKPADGIDDCPASSGDTYGERTCVEVVGDPEIGAILQVSRRTSGQILELANRCGYPAVRYFRISFSYASFHGPSGVVRKRYTG